MPSGTARSVAPLPVVVPLAPVGAGSRRCPIFDRVQDWTDNGRVSETPPATPAELLRRHGVQVTAQRLAVLRAVRSTPHGTADDIEALVRDEIGAISRQSVYDALGTLTDKGLIRRIQPARSPARYEGRVDDNHHHLVCRSCGLTVDVDCAVGSRPCLVAGDDHGFAVDEAEVVFWGLCPACRAAGDGAGDPVGAAGEAAAGRHAITGHPSTEGAA